MSVISLNKPTPRGWATPKGGVALTGTHGQRDHGARVLPEGVHAVMAIDPGGTTGVAAGHFRLHKSTKETLTKGRRMFKTTEVKGNWWQQAHEVAELINRFAYTAQAEHSLSIQHVHVTWENYTRRPAAASVDLTSVWVMACALGLLDRPELEHAFYEASEAKSYGSNERLRLWGLWVVGSEHMRDAARHLGLRVSDLISGKPHKGLTT